MLAISSTVTTKGQGTPVGADTRAISMAVLLECPQVFFPEWIASTTRAERERPNRITATRMPLDFAL
jgi:hypothetical protein